MIVHYQGVNLLVWINVDDYFWTFNFWAMSTLVPIGSDHAGFKMKQLIIGWLQEAGFQVSDEGCYSEERADYPDYAHAVANKITSKIATKGILLCGSGNGIAMTANKHNGIRAAICWTKELAELARLHNDANILVLPARFISDDEAIECVKVFMNTAFEGGRHTQRVEKIDFSC